MCAKHVHICTLNWPFVIGLDSSEWMLMHRAYDVFKVFDREEHSPHEIKSEGLWDKLTTKDAAFILDTV